MALISVVAALCALHLATASPAAAVQSTKESNVLRYEMETSGMPNSYKFYYDTKDGSSRTEEGSMVAGGSDGASLDVRGAARWLDDKGHVYEMTYKAGKRGYRTIIKKIS